MPAISTLSIRIFPASALLIPAMVCSSVVFPQRDYSLSEYRGKKVVIAFYPGDFTPG